MEGEAGERNHKEYKETAESGGCVYSLGYDCNCMYHKHTEKSKLTSTVDLCGLSCQQ